MSEFYADPAERERWGRSVVEGGLYPTEQRLLRAHFPERIRVLNIGCGGGREAFSLARRNYRVTAIDAEPGFVALVREGAEKRNLKIDARTMDALSLDFPDETFDAVVMVGQLIGHIRGRMNRVTALREAARVTKKGGKGLFSTNSIEARRLYRAYFFGANLLRHVYNPHRLERDDAFVSRRGGRRKILGRGPADGVFHWYRVPAFQGDLALAGWRPVAVARREDEETIEQLAFGGGTETFHVAARI
ncbi:class I SAM-dependent methyltransferase [bacterium]|nr:class I SAM-dependent methyltransferase [bacterium]